MYNAFAASYIEAMVCPTGYLTRDVLKLTGPQRFGFLQGLLTQNLDGIGERGCVFAALLSPQGKVLDTMFVWSVGESILLDTPAGRGAGLRKRLTLYKLRAKVDIADASEALTVVVAPSAEDLPERAMASSADPRMAALGYRALTGGEGSAAADDEYASFVSEHGIPQMGIDFDENEVFSLDINLDALNGIAHHKGCFVGQEVASRMFRKGEIRKRTYKLEGSGLEKGTSIMQGEKTLGRVTSCGKAHGLGIVRVDRLDAGSSQVTVGDRPVTLQRPAYLPA